ncbi:MAG: PEP-CTERM sorting domain-containing protein [Kiritimatiellia bacterium]
MSTVSRGARALAMAVGFVCLAFVPAQAMTVILDIGWGYYGNSDMTEADLIANYALQEGSIVQIIMYNSATHPSDTFQAGDPAANFDVGGSYGGAAVPGDPNVDPWDEPPLTTDVYDPDSAPAGHVIAYTTEIGTPVGGNANGYNWYNIYASFQILGTYDSMYIRVFGMTAFPDGSVGASYWGISSVLVSGAVLQTWFATYDDVTATEHVNYFEVIPEPGTLALLAAGGIGLWAARRRRLKRN